jgi:hypothetical protein
MVVDVATFGPEAKNLGKKYGIIVAFIIYSSFIVSIKRLHDRNKSGWLVLFSLIPIIGNIWYIVELGMLRGYQEENRFGKPVEISSSNDANINSSNGGSLSGLQKSDPKAIAKSFIRVLKMIIGACFVLFIIVPTIIFIATYEGESYHKKYYDGRLETASVEQVISEMATEGVIQGSAKYKGVMNWKIIVEEVNIGQLSSEIKSISYKPTTFSYLGRKFKIDTFRVYVKVPQLFSDAECVTGIKVGSTISVRGGFDHDLIRGQFLRKIELNPGYPLECLEEEFGKKNKN